MKVSFIGGGTMAEAMVAGVLGAKLTPPRDLVVADISPPRLDWLKKEYGVGTTSQAEKAASGADLVVLAVKPQDLAAAMGELKGKLTERQLALSIVAGATLSTLSQGLGRQAVVRVMPNIAARVGEALCIWTATRAVGEGQRELAHTFLRALGREIYVAEEKYLDMATAVSGSGPAYVFLFIEALIDAAVRIGLPRPLAQDMVLQTVLGSSRLAQTLNCHPAELRALVTSPGGTTAEALLRLEEGGLRGLIGRAVQAAFERSQALGSTH